MSKVVATFGVGITLSLGSGTAQAADPLVIIDTPPNIQTKWVDTFYCPKYIKIEKYNIHILGSPTVSDWFMRETHSVISNMLDTMNNPEDRAKFWGFQALLITNADPDLVGLGGVTGHRNSGGNGWSLFNEAVVCAKAVDTIRPNDAPLFRGWEVPLHEFGHAVELTLGLQAKTRALRIENNELITGAHYYETYAWAIQTWFSENPIGARAGFPTWEYNYIGTVFNPNSTWSPSSAPRPAAEPGPPAGYTWCAGEGGSFSLPGTCDVAYGANGVFLYRTGQTGTINFDNTTFGSDPITRVLKSGYYKLPAPSVKPVGPADYIWCASEGGSYTLPGLCHVAYGADGKFVYALNQTGTVTFTNNNFRPDPNEGVFKAGFYKPVSSTTYPVGPEGYTWCAGEYSTFTLPGVCDVAYGANGAFVRKYGVSGTVTFNNENFGPDPAEGVIKGGYYKLTSASRVLLAGSNKLATSSSTTSSKVNVVGSALQSEIAKASGSVSTQKGRVITFKKRPMASGNAKLSYQIEVSSDLGKKDPWVKVETTEDASQITAVLPKSSGQTFARLRVAIK